MKRFFGITLITLGVIFSTVLISIPGYLVVSLMHWNLDIAQWHWAGRVVFGVYVGYTFNKILTSVIDAFEKDKNK